MEMDGPTAEELTEELQQLDQQLDHIPTENTIKFRSTFSPETYRTRFGGWDEALAAAGIGDKADSTTELDPKATDSSKENNSSTDDQLLDEIQRLDQEYERVPLTTWMREEGKYSPYQYYNRFGSWDDALEAAGINKRDRLIQELKRLNETCDGRLTSTFFEDHSEYGSGYIVNEFGSWDDALEAAGIAGNSDAGGQSERTDTDLSGDDETDGVSEEASTKPTDKELLEEVRRLNRKTSGASIGNAMILEGKYKPAVYHRRFGGWDEALEAAGVTSQSESDRASTTAESDADEDTNNKKVEPNKLAELYESLRLLNKILIEYIEATPDIGLGDDEPVANWQSIIEDVAVGDGINSGVACLGQLHADRNPFSMTEYRKQYGDGDRVTDFHAIDMAEIETKERRKLVEVDDSSLPIRQRPIVPGEEKPIPILLLNRTDLTQALTLLEELITTMLDIDAVAPPTMSGTHSEADAAKLSSINKTDAPRLDYDPGPDPLTLADIDTDETYNDPIAGRLIGVVTNPSGEAASQLHLEDIAGDDFWLYIIDPNMGHEWKTGQWYFISQFRGPKELGGGRGNQALRSTPQLTVEDHRVTLPPTINTDSVTPTDKTESGTKTTEPKKRGQDSTQAVDAGRGGSEPTGQELLDELNRIDETLDRLPYPSDVNEQSEFTVPEYRERFGSWNEALASAGIDKETRLLEEFERLGKDLQKVPATTDMNSHGKYSAGIYNRYFGSWTATKKRYNEWKEGEEGITTISDDDRSETDNNDNEWNKKLSGKRLRQRLFSEK